MESWHRGSAGLSASCPLALVWCQLQARGMSLSRKETGVSQNVLLASRCFSFQVCK